MKRAAVKRLGRDRRITSGLSAGRRRSVGGLGGDDLGDRRCRELQRVQRVRDPASFIVPSSCPMTIQMVNVIPLGENAYWMTTAPPGITINRR